MKQFTIYINNETVAAPNRNNNDDSFILNLLEIYSQNKEYSLQLTRELPNLSLPFAHTPVAILFSSTMDRLRTMALSLFIL